MQAEQERICDEVFARDKSLKSRLVRTMLSKVDMVREDRRLLGVVFRFVALIVAFGEGALLYKVLRHA